MLINDLVALLMQIPPVLAAQWGAWFAAGLVLSIWTRREKAWLVVHGSTSRHVSGVRTPSGVRTSARAAKSAPVATTGDAFGELEALLDSHMGTHRPGDAPLLSEPAGHSPVLAGPQSLP